MATNRITNSDTAILDAFAKLRRDLNLVRAEALKAKDYGAVQMAILYRLSLSPATMGELSDYALIDKGAMTRAIAALEQSGLVRRKSDEADRRISIVELTSRGKSKASDAVAIRESISAKVNA